MALSIHEEHWAKVTLIFWMTEVNDDLPFLKSKALDRWSRFSTKYIDVSVTETLGIPPGALFDKLLSEFYEDFFQTYMTTMNLHPSETRQLKPMSDLYLTYLVSHKYNGPKTEAIRDEDVTLIQNAILGSGSYVAGTTRAVLEEKFLRVLLGESYEAPPEPEE